MSVPLSIYAIIRIKIDSGVSFHFDEDDVAAVVNIVFFDAALDITSIIIVVVNGSTLLLL